MAPPKRTFFIMLVTITGVLYFLYTIYTSTIDSTNYRLGSPSAVVKNVSQSSSPKNQQKKGQYSRLNDIIGSIINVTSNNINLTNNDNPRMSTNAKSVKNADGDAPKMVSKKKKEESSGGGNSLMLQNATAVNGTKIKGEGTKRDEGKGEKPKEESQNTVVQKISPKTENVSVDYILQGVKTKTVYDSGFSLPNTELCPDFGSHLELIIIITSAPKHFEARTAIRQTWGHYQMRKDVAIAFLLGRSAESYEPAIREEIDLYGDVILANFIDSYNNLTLKTISLLEWIDNYCDRAKFILKTDDDMFINIPKLLQFIKNHKKDKRKIFGKLAKKWKPIRRKTSKYYISIRQYKYSLFPDFTTGPAYLMTSDAVHDLYATALEKTYLKLEDVYTTGIVAQEGKIERVHVDEFFNRRVTLTPCNVQKGISIHMIKAHEQYDLWKKLLDGRSKC